ncbi:hypothetical protein JOD54_004223 [Actinokineospora baliensis]|uniref:hypothetical protein n=1 Tax=Actinokineospora baliensis TaxID=547056 RepID=UPI00195A9BE5|nr:hypothetical protein [Actinokineospora baliensis]MBM7774019.1 hypothetical protein [Actinokineospora baliensis]
MSTTQLVLSPLVAVAFGSVAWWLSGRYLSEPAAPAPTPEPSPRVALFVDPTVVDTLYADMHGHQSVPSSREWEKVIQHQIDAALRMPVVEPKASRNVTETIREVYLPEADTGRKLAAVRAHLIRTKLVVSVDLNQGREVELGVLRLDTATSDPIGAVRTMVAEAQEQLNRRLSPAKLKGFLELTGDFAVTAISDEKVTFEAVAPDPTTDKPVTFRATGLATGITTHGSVHVRVGSTAKVVCFGAVLGWRPDEQRLDLVAISVHLPGSQPTDNQPNPRTPTRSRARKL